MYSRRACCEHCQSHYARGHVSGGNHSVPWPIAVAWWLWLLWLLTFLDLPLASSRHKLWRRGGRRAHDRGWKIFRPGPRPRQGARCDAPWQGHSTYSQGNSRWTKWHCIHRSNEVVLGHITGRGHLAIPAHPIPSHLLCTAALYYCFYWKIGQNFWLTIILS